MLRWVTDLSLEFENKMDYHSSRRQGAASAKELRLDIWISFGILVSDDDGWIPKTAEFKGQAYRRVDHLSGSSNLPYLGRMRTNDEADWIAIIRCFKGLKSGEMPC